MNSPALRCVRALAALLVASALAGGCTPAPSLAPAPPGLTRSPATSAPAANTSTPTPSVSATPSVSVTPLPGPPQQSLTAEPSSTSVCAETVGLLQPRELSSPNLPRPLRVDVYLPPCHDPARAQPYLLLVLLHGQGFDQEQWARLGLPRAADRLSVSGEIPAMIIALPYEHDNLKNPFTTGYEAALSEDLLPWLAEEYHACAERGCRAIGGLSRGAAWAMRLAMAHPELFAAAGAHSLPPFYGDPARTPGWVRAIPPGQAPQLWLDAGERDRYRAEAVAYHELLEGLGVAHTWQTWPGGHDESYWSTHAEDYLRWYAGALGGVSLP